MQRLSVLYDASCALCVRCRDYLSSSATYVPVACYPSQGPDAQALFGAIPWIGEELVVVSDEGDVWIGPAAFLVCMWALRDTREWAYRLSTPALAPLAERFFAVFSANRAKVAAFLQPRCDDASCTGHSDPRTHALRRPYR